MTLRTRVTTLLILAGIAGTLGACGAEHNQNHQSSAMVPCASDDGGPELPCIWLAYERGNHQGRSFVVDAQGNVKPFGPVN